MNDYERQQLAELRRWQAEPPPPVARWFGKAAGPASQAVQTMIPTAALRAALDGLQNTADRLQGQRSLLKLAGVEHFEDLRQASLQDCDNLAQKLRLRASAMAGGAGAVLGIAGAAGMVVDVPALLLLAFRSIQRIGLCYGEALGDEAGRQLALTIFALASANSEAEKQAALDALHQQHAPSADAAAWRDGIERAAERELAKEAAVMSLNNLAKQLSRHLGLRKAASSMPVVGALIGGSVNAWYLWDLSTVASYCFQERWLTARHGALETLDAVPVPKRPSRLRHGP